MASRLYMDVHIPSPITASLRRRGVDVITSQEDGTREVGDEQLMEQAVVQGRILFTEDTDLLGIAASWQSAGRDFPGLIYAHQLGPGVGRIIDDLELLMLCTDPEELQNRVIHLPLR